MSIFGCNTVFHSINFSHVLNVNSNQQIDSYSTPQPYFLSYWENIFIYIYICVCVCLKTS